MPNYLYNGVELPDINEVWTDKDAYPYAVIDIATSAGMGLGGNGDEVVYSLGLFSAPLGNTVTLQGDRLYTVDGSMGDGGDYFTLRWAACTLDPTLAAEIGLETGTWYILPGFEGKEMAGAVGYDALWASYDVLNFADGTTYLAASEPVPVGGAEEETESISFIEYLVNPKYRMGKPFRGLAGWILHRDEVV